MNNKITATHENGSILTHKATDKDVEYAIALMKECGYIRFRIETPKDGRDQDGGCPWCGRDCPDAGKPQGCWYPGCPDFPHGE